MTSSILRMTRWEIQKIKGIQPPKQEKSMTLTIICFYQRHKLPHQKCYALLSVRTTAVCIKINPVRKVIEYIQCHSTMLLQTLLFFTSVVSYHLKAVNSPVCTLAPDTGKCASQRTAF